MKTHAHLHQGQWISLIFLLLSALLLTTYVVYKTVLQKHNTTTNNHTVSALELSQSSAKSTSYMLYTESYLAAQGLEALENELPLENWMLDLTLWNTTNTVTKNSNYSSENKITIEEWMYTLDSWNAPIVTSKQYAELQKTEETIALEKWMYTLDNWTIQ